MGELDDIEKMSGVKKKGGDMKGAQEGAEAIREWVSIIATETTNLSDVFDYFGSFK